MLKFLILLSILAFPNKPANLATEILIAGENAGLVMQAEDKDAAYRYVQFLHEDGDCLNDWLTHMQPGLRPIAQDYAGKAGLCDS